MNFYEKFQEYIEQHQLQDLCLLEDSGNFDGGNLLTPENIMVADRLLQRYKNNSLLSRRGVYRVASVLLGGEIGSGKTLMIHYLAYKFDLPILTIRYAGLLGGSLSDAMKGISAVFQAANQYPCVLCFDHIDQFCEAKGAGKWSKEDIQVSREISLMLEQELEQMSSSVFFIATVSSNCFCEAKGAGKWSKEDIQVSREISLMLEQELEQMSSSVFFIATVSSNCLNDAEEVHKPIPLTTAFQEYANTKLVKSQEEADSISKAYFNLFKVSCSDWKIPFTEPVTLGVLLSLCDTRIIGELKNKPGVKRKPRRRKKGVE